MFCKANIDQSLFLSHVLIASTLSHVLANVSTSNKQLYLSETKRYKRQRFGSGVAIQRCQHDKTDVGRVATGNADSKQCHFLETHLIVFRVRTQPATNRMLEGISLIDSHLHLSEWLSVAKVEAEHGSPGSGQAQSGVEKLSLR